MLFDRGRSFEVGRGPVIEEGRAMPEAPLRSRPWIGTSWKMTKTRAEANAYAEALAEAAPTFVDSVNAFVLPAYPLIGPVGETLVPAGIRVGSQNVHWAESGAFTGEVSAAMLSEVGATMSAIGHAERRALFGETDETVRSRAAGALQHGLTPLICIGESAAERAAGTEVPFVTRQLEIALTGLASEAVAATMVAYEPVWAIGEGSTPATADQADAMHAVIREALNTRHGEFGAAVPLLYGGSVDIAGAPELISAPNIDGLFVGRAAWSADGFIELARIVAAQ
ncbi:MAG: triose-phosphate isomerase [Actinomycetota bacterium]